MAEEIGGGVARLPGAGGALIQYVKQMGFTHVEFMPVQSTRLPVVGLPSDGLLRADEPLRHAGPTSST